MTGREKGTGCRKCANKQRGRPTTKSHQPGHKTNLRFGDARVGGHRAWEPTTSIRGWKEKTQKEKSILIELDIRLRKESNQKVDIM